MPAKDVLHNAVRAAVIKDGWTITHDPFHIKYGGLDFYIDLGAEGLIGASKDGQKIAVEIKSFIGASSLNEFHAAVGQFINYRLVLKQIEQDRILYLAISDYIYNSFFTNTFGQLAVKEHQLKLLVFDEAQEVVVQWLP